jgi:hypothetical protein
MHFIKNIFAFGLRLENISDLYHAITEHFKLYTNHQMKPVEVIHWLKQNCPQILFNCLQRL